MSRTFVRQDTQVRQTTLFNDDLAAGQATLETASDSLEYDLNSLRSQAKRWLWGDVAGNWYDDVPTYNSKKRGIAKVNEDLDDIEEKRFLFRAQILTDVTVTAAQNWEVLSVAGSETPTEVAAVGAVATQGAIVAYNATFDAHSLAEVVGPNAVNPKNLVLVRDATSGDLILSGGKQVYGLLQCEANVDGHTFNDTTQQAQISFVIENATADDLIACPVIDIAGKTVNYSYVRRVSLDNIPEWAFLTGVFVDEGAAAIVSRQVAYDNQGVTPVESLTNAFLDLGTGLTWSIRDVLNASLLHVVEGSTGGTSEIEFGGDVDVFDNNAVSNLFSGPLTVDDDGTDIEIGVVAGQINTLASNDLEIQGGAELYLDDANRSGSTFAQDGVKLSDTTAEWDNYESRLGGELSLLAGITKAAKMGNRQDRVFANLTANVNADTDVGGVGGGANLDAQLPNLSLGTFLTDYDVFVNGELMRPGANAAANNDYYPGTSLVNGQLKFEFKLHTGDVICVQPYDADHV